MFKRFNDSPIETVSKSALSDFDKIEVSSFAESLADFITTCETPMTVGLQGDWGTGKTSLMNMIKSYLPDRKYYKVDVNTWHYSIFRQDEYLGIVVVKSLIEQLGAVFEKKDNDFASVLKDLGSKLGNGIKAAAEVGKKIQIPHLNVSAGDFMQAYNSSDSDFEHENLSAILLEFKRKFTELIEENVVKKNERIFFFVDDLDRIKPLKAIEVLETLKNFMDVEGCVFVLAVDYEIVQMGIAEKFGRDIQKTSGKSFFDKIIQLPFNMPTASYNIESYISDLLKESKFYSANLEKNPQDKEFFVEITEVTVGRNPRSIKRAINYATLLEKIRARNSSTKETGIRKDRETSKLLYAIVCMQIAWPELFEYFILKPTPETIKHLEDWDYLDALPHAQRLFARVRNVDETKDNISAYFDTLYSVLDSEEKDGVITDKELKPLLDVLKLVRLTTEKSINKSENQIKKFKSKLSENLKGNYQCREWSFFTDFFEKSYFTTNDLVEFKAAGAKYHTIVWNRKQIGSLVSYKTKHSLVIRLKNSRDEILQQLKGHSDISILDKVVLDFEEKDIITGIGDTILSIEELVSLNDKKQSIQLLNAVFSAIVQLNTV